MKNCVQKFKSLILTVLVSGVVCGSVFAQDPYTAYPGSDSKSLIREVQNPVDYYTGTVNIRVPLYTVEADGVTIPIILSYQASGIKVTDKPTSVGLGWRYSAGGKITRIVKQRPDENVVPVCSHITERCGWLNWKCESVSELDSLRFHKHIGCNTKYCYLCEIDTEPDIYYFELLGSSGMFVMDHDNRIYTIPYQDIQISYNKDSDGNIYFIVIDNQGNKYMFGTKETSRETSKAQRGSWQMNYVSTWLLDEIEPMSGEKVEFAYAASEATPTEGVVNKYQMARYSKVDGKYLPVKDMFYKENTSLRATIARKYLQEIKWSRGKVRFAYRQYVDKDAHEYEMMDNICVSSYDNKVVSDMYLDYSFFRNGSVRLDGIREKFGQDMQYLYKFKYNTLHNLPEIGSAHFDHWGYYNGPTQYNNYIPEINDVNVQITGASREPNFLYTKANILTEVESPTGTSTRYTYELNRIYGSVTVPSQPFGGLRIAKIEKYMDGKWQTVRAYGYETSPGKSSGKAFQNRLRYYYKFGNSVDVYSNCVNNIYDFGGNHMSYSRVTEYYPNGSYVVYNYDEGTDCDDPEWDPENDIYPECTTDLENMELIAPPTSYFWRRGLLTSQVVYDSEGKQLSKTSHQYTFGPAVRTIECYVPYYKDAERMWNHIYRWVSEPVLLTKTVVEKGQYNTASETVYEYDANHMLPTSITVTDAQGNVSETRVKYSFDYGYVVGSYFPDDDMTMALEYMNNRAAYAVPIETVRYRNGNIVGGELRLYKPVMLGPKVSCVRPWKTMRLYLNDVLPPTQFEMSGLVTLDTYYSFEYDSRYEDAQYFDEFADTYKLVSSSDRNSKVKSVIYGEDCNLPIANIENAVYSTVASRNQVFYDSFETGANRLEIPYAKSGRFVLNGAYSVDLRNCLAPGTYKASYWRKRRGDTSAKWEYVEKTVTVTAGASIFSIPASATYTYDELRILPEGGVMTTYAYDSVYGKISETSQDGRTTYYEYDKFGLLKAVRDNDYEIVKKFVYDDHSNN